jgi:leader peptidase (prepilin peptidase) / N-methyltransferase
MSHLGDMSGPVRSIALMGVGAALVPTWAASADTEVPWMLFSCLLGWTLLALGWIDWKTLRLPDALTLPLVALGLAAAWTDSQDALLSGAIGALVGYGALVAVNLGYRRLRGRDGLGRGDAKLLAAGGAWLGWQALPWIVLLAALLGLLLAALQRARGSPLTAESAIPFGPPLALAIWIIWIYGVPFA